jgi:hypothetical protein
MFSDKEFAGLRDLMAHNPKTEADVRLLLIRLEQELHDPIDLADRAKIQNQIDEIYQALTHIADVLSSIRRLDEKLLDSIAPADRARIRRRIDEHRQDLEHTRLKLTAYVGGLETPLDGIPTDLEKPPAKPKQAKAEKRRQDVVAYLEALMNLGLVGVPRGEIAQKAGIKYGTFARYLKHKNVKPVWERYQRASVGKPPGSLNALGDGEFRAFSFPLLKPK